ncbi:hypothetical protein BBH88_12795 [Planococcus antarcticus DSM 14505]|uniref:DUF1659 domain-containing protein n=1 Tax=Planococcus antarcticus DSM 14505 TaxID=1185653 RepID=A0ABM6D6Q5_9BACL|nr:DUF1659 domain-containing protein [Planococcus antarcticus]ANU11111.1 hypothetical protein BBH88_12795 [Planococcus antarcticus DSM 14505]
MAFSDFKSASIRCTYDNGLDANGKVKRKFKSYLNVKEASTADGIFETAAVLTNFGTKTLMDVEKQSAMTIYQ